MKIPKINLNYVLTIILLPAFVAITNSVAGNLGYKAGETETPTKSPTEKMITQRTNEQNIGNDNDCSTQISSSDGNSVNCSNIEKVENQENIERKIEAEQYNESRPNSNPINCNRSNGTCGDGGTTNINSSPGK